MLLSLIEVIIYLLHIRNPHIITVIIFLNRTEHVLFQSIYKQKSILQFYNRPGCKAALILRQTIVQGSPTIFEENVSTTSRA